MRPKPLRSFISFSAAAAGWSVPEGGSTRRGRLGAALVVAAASAAAFWTVMATAPSGRLPAAGVVAPPSAGLPDRSLPLVEPLEAAARRAPCAAQTWPYLSRECLKGEPQVVRPVDQPRGAMPAAAAQIVANFDDRWRSTDIGPRSDGHGRADAE